MMLGRGSGGARGGPTVVRWLLQCVGVSCGSFRKHAPQRIVLLSRWLLSPNTVRWAHDILLVTDSG